MKFTTTTLKDTPLHLISTTQFKSMHLTMRFFADLDEKTATSRHLMLSMLKAKNKQFPSRTLLSRHLESLYDTAFMVNSHKLGTKHINQFSLRFVNPSYTDDTAYMDQVIEVLKSALYEPVFDAKTLKEEKQFLKDYFAAEYSNKNRYAAKRYFDHLYENHPYRVHPYGLVEAIDAITLSDIEAAYKGMVATDTCLVSLSGDFDEALMKAKLEPLIRHQRPPLEKDIFIRHDFPVRPKVTENLEVTQDRLFMTLKTGIHYGDDLYYPLAVMNAMYGETGESKLFANIREKASLAYYVHSAYSPFSGIITVASGMDKTNIARAEAMILDQLKAIQAGDFDETDIQIAKNHLITNLKQSYDNIGSLALKGLRHALFDVPFKENVQLDKIKAVSKADIIAVAGRLEHIFTYVLTGGSQNENHPV